ncbi:MAG: DUF5004 domain-containing protein [Sphingobacteriaceae bacterium]|nr:MAG: DUF5004 domain-containing protein [Sphingobacteriaceae bacterium]
MKNLYKNSIICFCILLVAILLISSCKTEKIVPNAEALKDVNGSWQVIKAVRNGVDITSLADFTQFKLNFDGSNYTLTNKLPFIVLQNGTYSFDDPQYPFQISLTPTGAKAVTTPFTYPIINGVRQLSITFSPGCANNSYVYTFQKSN